MATDTPGRVSVTLALAGLRVLYYNPVLAVAAEGGVELARALETTPASLAVAAGVSLVATVAFPRLAEEVSRRVVDGG